MTNVYLLATAMTALVTGCSASTPGTTAVTTSAQSSADLFASLSNPTSQAEAKANWTKVGALNPSAFGKQLFASLDNNTFTIDGAVFSNVQSTLAAKQATFDHLDERYGSMHAAFADFNITVNFTSSIALIKQQAAALQAEIHPHAALGLQEVDPALSATGVAKTDDQVAAEAEMKTCNGLRNSILSWYQTDAYQNPQYNQSFADHATANAKNEALLQYQGSREPREALAAENIAEIAGTVDDCKLTGAANMHYSDGNHSRSGDGTADPGVGG